MCVWATKAPDKVLPIPVVQPVALAALPRRSRLGFSPHMCASPPEKPSAVCSFISTGLSKWKDEVMKFSKHESSRCHKKSVLKVNILPRTTHDIGESFSLQLRRDRLEAQQRPLKILSNACFLA